MPFSPAKKAILEWNDTSGREAMVGTEWVNAPVFDSFAQQGDFFQHRIGFELCRSAYRLDPFRCEADSIGL